MNVIVSIFSIAASLLLALVVASPSALALWSCFVLNPVSFFEQLGFFSFLLASLAVQFGVVKYFIDKGISSKQMEELTVKDIS